MTGWKTWAAGLSSLVTGVGILLAAYGEAGLAGLTGDKIVEAMAFISGGLGVIGVGHKVEKAAK